MEDPIPILKPSSDSLIHDSSLAILSVLCTEHSVLWATVTIIGGEKSPDELSCQRNVNTYVQSPTPFQWISPIGCKTE